MNFQLALVTGAASGLGKAICQLLAKENIPLVLVSKNELGLKALAEDLSQIVPIESFLCNLSVKDDRAKLVELIHLKQPDLVINNAGFGLYGDILTHSTVSQMDILEVNGNAVVELSIEAARTLLNKKRGGTIVNISSAASFFIYPSFAIYAASKAFVNQFSQGFDAEVKPYGIRVLASCPGQINSGFRARASRDFPQKIDSYAMTCEKAANLILHQIKIGRSLYIFDWYYRLAVFIARFLIPNRLLQKILRRGISSRYKT